MLRHMVASSIMMSEALPKKVPPGNCCGFPGLDAVKCLLDSNEITHNSFG